MPGSHGYGVISFPGSGGRPRCIRAVGLRRARLGHGGPQCSCGYPVLPSTTRHHTLPTSRCEDVLALARGATTHGNSARYQRLRRGGSSGAHLIGLVALLAQAGISDDSDPVNREPATLQAIVLRAAPTDLGKMSHGAVVLFMERLSTAPDGERLYSAAFPITHVSPSSPPVLLLHGDSDDTVPFEQSVALEGALRRVNVPVKLVRIAGGEHGPNFETAGKPHADLPKVLGETVTWLDDHLKPRSARSTK